MSLWNRVFLVLVWVLLALANKMFMTEMDSQICSGMYSKQDWSGPTDPYIKLNVQQFQKFRSDSRDTDIDISIVIFEYRDIDQLGIDLGDGRTRYICDDYMVTMGFCDPDQLNQFVLSGNSTRHEVLVTDLQSLGDNNITYHIRDTGYYCVASYSPTTVDSKVYANDYKVLVNFQNAFGSLSAAEIPKLPLYGLLAICYASSLCIYLFQVFRHRTELLLLQKYLALFFVFLTVENILIWSLYEVQNNNKRYPLPSGIKFYLFFVSILNSFKITFSFFLLLIIALGYGFVYPKLNKKLMTRCKILAGVHFLFGVLYLSVNYIRETSVSTTPSTSTTGQASSNTGSYLSLLTTIPVAITMAVFYFLILSSLSKTVKHLTDNRQVVKLSMYKKLFNLIFASLLAMILALVITTAVFFNDSVTNAIEKFWKFNRVLMDFWPSALYFFVFLGIAVIWRPTDTSYMLAVSQQIPTTDLEANSNNNNNNISQQYGTEFELDDLQSNDESSPENPFADPKKKASTMNDDDSIDFGLDENEQDEFQSASVKNVKPPIPSSQDSDNATTVFELGDVEDEDPEFDEWERTTPRNKKD